MGSPDPEEENHRRRRGRWAARLGAVILISLVIAILALVPVVPASQEFSVASNGGNTTGIRFLFPTEVVMHFLTNGPLAATFSVTGPELPNGIQVTAFGGHGVSVSFWTWGGSYSVRIGDLVLSCPIGGCPLTTFPVWINVTTGVL